MNKEFWFIVVLFLTFLRCEAQSDSLQIDFDIIFGADRFFPNKNNKIYLPDNIKEQRVANSSLSLDFNEYTDTPQLHASVFAGLCSKLSLAKGYQFHLDLFAEDRGQSFGSLNLNKVIFFPRIYGSILDTFHIFNTKWKLEASIGDLLAYQHNLGLTIINVDAQGIELKLHQGNWYLGYTLVGDLSLHVGLNMEEFYSYKLGYLSKKSANEFLDIGISLDQYLLVDPNQTRNHISIFTNRQIKRHNFYVEISRNILPEIQNNTSYLIGYKYEIHLEKKFKWNLETSFRHFGKGFNNDFIESTPRFRDLSIPTLANNSVGDFLYPLINAYRPFNQWSVYAEYESKALSTLRLQSMLERKILNDLFLLIKYEGLTIWARDTENAFYNFYSAGFKYKLPANTSFEIYITNKMMNLDVHYQTFYQAQVPVIGFSIKRVQGYK